MRDGTRAATMMDLSSKEYAMRSYFARGIIVSLGFALVGSLPAMAAAQEYGIPSLLPVPTQDDSYTTSRTAHQDTVVVEADPRDNPAAADNLPSPSDTPLQAPESFKNAMQQWGDDSPCSSGACGYGGCGCGPWFGSVGALILGSPTRTSTYLSYDSATYLPVMQTGQVNGQFSGGIDFTVGKMFGCGNWGSSFSYWGIYPTRQTADIYNTDVTGNLGSYLNFGGLNYNGNPAANYWTNVVHQRIVTNQVINSAEWNLLGNCGCGLYGCNNCTCGGPCGPRLGAGWTMGLRYFQYNDAFRFYSDNLDNVLDGSVNEMQYNVSTRNSLIGFQLGGGLNYRVWNCFSLYGIGKAGIYNNHATVDQAAYGSAGDAIVNVGPYAGSAYRFRSTSDCLAFLGQLDMGGRYQMSKCWSIDGGYRMVGVSGLALTDGQIPGNFAYLPNAQRVHATDSIILHGGYVGATFCW